jgi:hypothetical protein
MLFLVDLSYCYSRGDLTLHAEHYGDLGDIYIFFLEDPKGKIGVKPLSDCLKKMNESNIKSGIFVVQSDFNPRAKELIGQVADINVRVEYFLEQELLVNVTKHVCNIHI